MNKKRYGINILLDRSGKRKILLVLLALTLGTVLEMAGISLLLPLIAAVSNQVPQTALPWLAPVLGLFAGQSNGQILLTVSSLLISVILVKNLLLYWIGIEQKQFIIRDTNNTIARLYEQYLRAPYENLLALNSNEVIAVLNYHVVFSYKMLECLLFLGKDLLVVLFITLLMALIDIRLTVFLALVLGTVLFIVAWVVNPRIAKTSKSKNSSDLDLFKMASGTLNSVKEIKVLHREDAFIAEYSLNCRRNSVFEKQKETYIQLPSRMMEVIFTACALSILLALTASADNPVLFLPKLSVLSLAIIRAMPSVMRIHSGLGNVAFYKPSLDKLHQELARLDQLPASQSQVQVTGGNSLPFSHDIRLKQVTYRYPNSGTNILHNLDLEIAFGEWVGLTGCSGIGKTTLVDLALGLLRPAEGAVLIDGRDIAGSSVPWGRRAGYVPQMILLLDGTVRDNVLFGAVGQKDEAVWEALRVAEMDGFVAQMPDQLDTPVGERGIRLSGGERQRIGIARAILLHPELLVLDEGTAALDEQTEQRVLDNLAELPFIKTCIMVAHRRSSLKRCRRVLHLAPDGIREESCEHV